MKDKSFNKELFALAIPFALQGLLNALVGASDALMLGRLTQESISAVSLANERTFILSLFTGAVLGGAGTLVAQYFGKGDKERRVYFDAKAKVHLSEYLSGRTDNNPALFVTLDAPHDRLQISGVEIRLRSLGRKLSLDRIHPHKFRRTVATRAIDKGMPIEQVQKMLGHSQIDTTMQYVIVNQNNVKASHQKYIA